MLTGLACIESAECVPGAECLNGFCRCETGKVGCGTELCADLASDPSHCGRCDHECAADAACIDGECSLDGHPNKPVGGASGDASAPGQLAITIDTPTFIVGGSSPVATNTCVNEGEVVPSQVPSGSSALFFAGFGVGKYSEALTSWNNWIKDTSVSPPAAFKIPPSTKVTALHGDTWTTFSSSNGLVYASAPGTQSGGGICTAIAATTPSFLVSNIWTAPYQCEAPVTPDILDDQQAIAFDEGLRTFYSAANEFSNGAAAGMRLNFYKTCQAVPGDPACPLTGTLLTAPASRLAIDVNPCTNNMVLAYRSGGDIRIRFYDRDRMIHGAAGGFLVAGGQSQTGKNAGCGGDDDRKVRRCNLGTVDCVSPNLPTDSCLRIALRPSINVKFRAADARCYASIAWDYVSTASDGNRYVKSRLAVVDVSFETSPRVLKLYQSTFDSNAWNQYLSYTTTSTLSTVNSIGWFWASDNRSPCSVGWEGAVDSNLGLTTMTSTGKYSGIFPAIVTDDFLGISDYAAGVRGGDGVSRLMPTWPELVPTTAAPCINCPCNQCNVGAGPQNWSNAAKTTRIQP